MLEHSNSQAQRHGQEFNIKNADTSKKNKIKVQQNRMNAQNENYLLGESPELNNRRLNNKAGVQLAPIGVIPPKNQGPLGRQSLLSMNEIADMNGTESHPILRVQNFKKPTLDKIQMPGQSQHNIQNTTNSGFTVNMGQQDIEQRYMNDGKIQMTF